MFGLGLPEIIILGLLIYGFRKCIREQNGFGVAGLMLVVLLIAGSVFLSYLSHGHATTGSVIVPSQSSQFPSQFPVLELPRGRVQVTPVAWLSLMLVLTLALTGGIAFTFSRTRSLGAARYGLAVLALVCVAAFAGIGFVGYRTPQAVTASPALRAELERKTQHLAGLSLSSETGEIQTAPDEKPTEVIERVYHDSGKLVSQKSLQDLPAWVREPEHSKMESGDSRILFSERYATADEARATAWVKIADLVSQRIEAKYPDVSRWTPSQEEIRSSGLIQRECEIGWPIEVGGFTEQVHQVCWQVKFSSAVLDQLYTDHKPVIVRERVSYLAIALGCMTFLFGAVALLLRPGPIAVAWNGDAR